MKKIIAPIIISLALTGCATTNMQPGEQHPADKISGTTKVMCCLATPEINQVMSDADKVKLQQLVTSAKSNQKINWQGSNKYEFESINIFVNKEGQACRKYKLTGDLGSFIFHSEKQAELIACRDDDGAWKLVA